MKTWRAVASAVLVLMLAATTGAQSALTLKVHTGRGQTGYDVNSTMIIGERDILLIDPQFSLSEAHRLAAELLETKKRVATIYATHAHPDHLFGLAVLKQAFPEARIVALPATVNAAKTGWPARQKFWFATYGTNIPGPEPVLPEELQTPVLTLEGEQFPITGGVQGADGPGNSFVWIPSLRAVVAGDTVFYRRHIGVPADPKAWLETLDKIDALGPRILVSGHKPASAPDDPAATTWLRGYIADFNTFRMQSKTGAELKAKMLAKYGDSAMPARLDQSIEQAFPPPK